MTLLSKPVILCDIDGVIAEYWGPFLKQVNRDFGTNFIYDDIIDYWACDNLLMSYLGTKENIENYLASVFWEESFLKNQPLILPSLSGLRKIGGMAQVHVVTSRSTEDRPYMKPTTKAWLDRYGIPYQKLAFRKDKDVYAREVGATHIIEDSAEMVEKCLLYGMGAFLVDAPYNRDFDMPGCFRIATLQDVPALLAMDLTRV